MLNPFEQELTKLRAAKPEEAALPSRIMEGEDDEEQRLGFGLMSAPTFLFLRAGAKEISACANLIASASYNFASTVDLLHQFLGGTILLAPSVDCRHRALRRSLQIATRSFELGAGQRCR
jgi:hypothetical protein